VPCYHGHNRYEASCLPLDRHLVIDPIGWFCHGVFDVDSAMLFTVNNL
jgi:hypothetical protein